MVERLYNELLIRIFYTFYLGGLEKITISLENCFGINKNKIKQLGVDSYSNMYIKYSMINPSRNSIDIIMNSDGKIKYKLGNYVGHMCNKTSEQLINKLRKDGWSVAINSIKRDISNSRQLVMERELK